jgi:hypothetical protein
MGAGTVAFAVRPAASTSVTVAHAVPTTATFTGFRIRIS